MELFDLNSNLNNLFESSSIKDFLVDSSVNFLVNFLICLCISFMALKILKVFATGLILMLFVFLFHGQYFYLYDPFHQFLL